MHHCAETMGECVLALYLRGHAGELRYNVSRKVDSEARSLERRCIVHTHSRTPDNFHSLFCSHVNGQTATCARPPFQPGVVTVEEAVHCDGNQNDEPVAIDLVRGLLNRCQCLHYSFTSGNSSLHRVTSVRAGFRVRNVT